MRGVCRPRRDRLMTMKVTMSIPTLDCVAFSPMLHSDRSEDQQGFHTNAGSPPGVIPRWTVRKKDEWPSVASQAERPVEMLADCE